MLQMVLYHCCSLKEKKMLYTQEHCIPVCTSLTEHIGTHHLHCCLGNFIYYFTEHGNTLMHVLTPT